MVLCCFNSNGSAAAGQPLPALLPPEPVDEDKYFARIFEEAHSILDADLENFDSVSRHPNYSVHRKRVHGSQMTMTRLEAQVEMQSHALFRLMTSVDGYTIIDPDTKNHGQGILQALHFPAGRALINLADTPLGWPLDKREFLTCDVVDSNQLLFVSKSCELQAEHPHALPRPGHVRALNTYALRVRPSHGGGSLVQMSSWLDLGGSMPVCLVNAISERVFFQGLMKRLAAYMSVHRLGLDTPPDRWPEAFPNSNRVAAEGKAEPAAPAAEGKVVPSETASAAHAADESGAAPAGGEVRVGGGLHLLLLGEGLDVEEAAPECARDEPKLVALV